MTLRLDSLWSSLKSAVSTNYELARREWTVEKPFEKLNCNVKLKQRRRYQSN